MITIRARNVHTALPLGLKLLAEMGQPTPSRNGDCLTLPYPVTTIIERPYERVLFYPERDANPFFHFFEALWMLAGRNDVGFLTRFNRRMAEYSDDGQTLAAAYGHRWRKHFGFDQIERVIALLQQQPTSRRAVIVMWDPRVDLIENEEASKDIPCNDLIMFRNIYGARDEPNRLNMTVICRSHDIIWGAFGANAVHFSFLQEYVASHLGLMTGTMTTVSNNFHAYVPVYNKIRKGELAPGAEPLPSLYEMAEVAPCPIIHHAESWDRDLALFLEAPRSYGYLNPFFAQVAKPLWFAHMEVKARNYNIALEILKQCKATDWRQAAEEWIKRRIK